MEGAVQCSYQAMSSAALTQTRSAGERGARALWTRLRHDQPSQYGQNRPAPPAPTAATRIALESANLVAPINRSRWLLAGVVSGGTDVVGSKMLGDASVTDAAGAALAASAAPALNSMGNKAPRVTAQPA